jgi:hypothetical protein
MVLNVLDDLMMPNLFLFVSRHMQEGETIKRKTTQRNARITFG